MSQTAEQAYLENHSQALATLQELQNAMFDLPAPESEVRIDWGHVGSVAELNRQLQATLQFIQGNQDAESSTR